MTTTQCAWPSGQHRMRAGACTRCGATDQAVAPAPSCCADWDATGRVHASQCAQHPLNAPDACGHCGQSVDDWPTRDCEEPLNHRYAPPRSCDCGDEVTVEQSVDNPRQHARCHLIP